MTLAELEALRAGLPDDDQLPASATQADLSQLRGRRQDLDARLQRARAAAATLATLREPDPTWEGHLHVWRKVLCDELLAPVEHLTPQRRAYRQNLTLSIRVCDFGPDALTNTDYDLVSLRLGTLMRESGFEVQGACPGRHYSGVLPWFGGLKDLERQAREVAKRRAKAEADRADALLDDAERERREAEQKQLRDAFNSMRVRNSTDPNAPGLRVVDREGRVIDESTLTDVQRKALARFRETLLEQTASVETVTT